MSLKFSKNYPLPDYGDIHKLSEWVYRNVNPATREVQQRLTPYTPKHFGEKRTYSQDWPIYERACSQEKLMFFRILKDAIDQMEIPYQYKGNGRPPVDYSDIVKSLCIRSYSGYSSWRAESELKIARAMGTIHIVHRRSTLNKYLQDPKVAELLHRLYTIIAEPLAEIEMYFAADATGISNAYGSQHWSKIRNTPEEHKQRRQYAKLHIITGVKTNVICAAKITSGTAHESPFLKPLLDDTAKIFTMREVSADAGYLSRENVQAIAAKGAAPFIMGKKNVHVPSKGRLTPWVAMLRLWKHQQSYFAERYHRRSNVESTFGALKRKFGHFCRSKKQISQENEILAKIVCFNASVLAEALLSYDLRGGFMDGL